MTEYIKQVLVPILLTLTCGICSLVLLDHFGLVTDENGAYIGLSVGAIWSIIVMFFWCD